VYALGPETKLFTKEKWRYSKKDQGYKSSHFNAEILPLLSPDKEGFSTLVKTT
jgi:hypothetical protein